MKTIELKSVGPIERLAIPVPEEGGVVVLRGRNGIGKSYALAGVEALARPATRKALRPNDEAAAGTVTGCGITLRLGRSNTVKGELECATLDAACDPSVLVDPGLKDPEAADRRRLETLVRLLGVRITAEQWGQLFNGDMERYRDAIDLSALSGDDPVETADRIRRRLHAKALEIERLVTTTEGEADALARTVGEVNERAECDEATLRRMVDEATERWITARNAREAADRQEALARNARQRLAEASSGYQGPTVAEAAQRVEEAVQRGQTARDTLHQVETVLEQARAAVKQCEADWRAAKDALAAAESHERTVASWKGQLDLAAVSGPSREQVEELARQKAAAQLTMEEGARVRGAVRARAEAEAIRAKAAGLAEEAQALREVARSTDAVLESALGRAGVSDVRVQGGRLCVVSSRRGGLEPVSELSHGERWALALDLAARGIGRGGLLTVEQEAWESLDPDNREAVSGMAKSRGLVIVTAEAAHGELRAEPFDADAA